jgi:uncharacterized protein
MPYYISDKQNDCSGWATLKVVNGNPTTIGCHATKTAAIKHMVALSLAEKIAPAGEYGKRKASGTKAVIVDIDDTLIHAGKRIDKTYNYVESLNVHVLLVTGRPESTRDATTKQLANLDISYNRLYMNPGSSANSNAFKKAKAEELLKTYNIIEAIENNPDARRGYADLGIPTKDPAKLPMMKHQDTGNKNSDQQRTIMTDAKLRAVSRAERIVATLRKINGVKPIAETRISDIDFEIRAEGDKLTFSGYAAVFNSDSHPLPFIERIAPGAFKRSLQARNDVKLLWNHDSGEVLASTRSGTMRLYEDSVGLKVEAELAPTTRGKDLSILMQRGDVNKMSFGFTVQQDSWSPDGNTRTLESVRLIEASIVTFPAYEASVAQVRSLDQIDTDKLSDALLALETSDSLTPDQAGLLENVIKQLTKGELPVEEEKLVEEKTEEPVTMIGLLQLKHTLEGKML